MSSSSSSSSAPTGGAAPTDRYYCFECDRVVHIVLSESDDLSCPICTLPGIMSVHPLSTESDFLPPSASFMIDLANAMRISYASLDRILKPPASQSAIDSLRGVKITDNMRCAVCREEITIGRDVKEMPCHHPYHKDCIFTWLKVTNTCPVCRYELPTDDLIYERLKLLRAENQAAAVAATAVGLASVNVGDGGNDAGDGGNDADVEQCGCG